MVKHIMYGSIWQSVILMIVAFAGEYIIYEPDVLARFDRAATNTIYPGRDYDWDGKELFLKWHDPKMIWRKNLIGDDNAPMTVENFAEAARQLGCADTDYIYYEGGYSKHFTFFFNLFVMF